MVKMKHWFGASVALAASIAAGCGGEVPKTPLVPASGRVTLGEEPAEGVEVRLFDATRVNDADAPHPFATTDAEGKFKLGTFTAGDGAPVGRFKVMLLWPEGPVGPGVPRDRLGNAFTNPVATPLETTIPEKGGELEPIVLDPDLVKKAARRKAATDPAAGPTPPG